MKIFTDKKAERSFMKIYDSLSKSQRTIFVNRIRKLANEKLLSETGTEFYVTIDDVSSVRRLLTKRCCV